MYKVVLFAKAFKLRVTHLLSIYKYILTYIIHNTYRDKDQLESYLGITMVSVGTVRPSLNQEFLYLKNFKMSLKTLHENNPTKQGPISFEK